MDSPIPGLSLIAIWFVTQVIFIFYIAYSLKKIREEIVKKGRLIPLIPTIAISTGMMGVSSHSQPPACK